jgi:hypothetical protein
MHILSIKSYSLQSVLHNLLIFDNPHFLENFGPTWMFASIWPAVIDARMQKKKKKKLSWATSLVSMTWYQSNGKNVGQSSWKKNTFFIQKPQ